MANASDDNCTELCSMNCFSSDCDPGTAACLIGCVKGMEGPMCDEGERVV